MGQSFDCDAAAESAARAAIRADLERLGGPARGRYRAALRRLMREARDERAPDTASRAAASAAEWAMMALAGFAIAAAAILGGPEAGALVGACAAGGLALTMMRADAPAQRRQAPRFAADERPAAMAMALHRAALAESRRDYYAGSAAPAR